MKDEARPKARGVSEVIRVGRRTISISNRDKVLFPDDGVTKGDVIDYYAAVAPAMLPYTRKRPDTLERYPDGIEAQRIFQKNAAKYFPEWIPRASMPKKGGTVEHVIVGDAASLVYLANQATITHHMWLSTVEKPAHPDQLIFDLDPSGDTFADVRRTALMLRDLLRDAGLVPFVKTSGSKGLHVVTPLRPVVGFAEVYGYARAVAEELIAEHPRMLTLEFSKAQREGRIFMDVNRNAYAQTAAAPYSVRARRGAPVAVPLAWDEVEERSLRPDGISMTEALRRASGPDPWNGFRGAARSLKRLLP